MLQKGKIEKLEVPENLGIKLFYAPKINIIEKSLLKEFLFSEKFFEFLR